MSIIRKMIDAHVKDVVQETIDNVLERRLPGLVEASAAKICRDTPNAPLTQVGFRWACALFLRQHWPDVPKWQAADWLAEYAGVPYGTKGYEWTPNAAKALADAYVNEFGEHGQ